MATAFDQDYTELLSLDDVLSERHSGEYLPVVRGDYVRRKLYIDLQTRKSCGIVSYINYARDGQFWVANKVLRIYHQGQAGSVSKGWTSPAKAIETVCRCSGNLWRAIPTTCTTDLSYKSLKTCRLFRTGRFARRCVENLSLCRINDRPEGNNWGCSNAVAWCTYCRVDYQGFEKDRIG